MQKYEHYANPSEPELILEKEGMRIEAGRVVETLALASVGEVRRRCTGASGKLGARYKSRLRGH